MKTYDVIIIGGGVIGLTVACGLQDCGLRIAVLEKVLPDIFHSREEHGLRVSTINMASERLLQHLGVWSLILSLRASSYHSIEVWERDGFGYIEFNQPKGISHLGYVIENKVIKQALWQRAQQLNNITLLVPTHLQQVTFGKNEVYISMKNDTKISARLLIGADGAHSWLRNEAAIPLIFWDYNHYALIANVRTEQPHQSVARQIFYGNGILAFLPLSDPYLCSIVWSLSPQEAMRLRDMPTTLFNSQLSVTFDMRLGRCQVESKRQTFPLAARYANQFSAHRLVLVGDAAHTIHPLTGQGVNLGFMDAAELIGDIRRLHKQGKDFGQYLYLRRYERNRKYSAALVLASIQIFRELFSGTHLAKKLMRNVGLCFVNKLPKIKPFLLKQAMGLYELPEWLR